MIGTAQELAENIDMGRVDEQEFQQIVERRSQVFLSLLHRFVHTERPRDLMTRPLLGELLAHAVQVEELLDSYDASRNCQWCRLRALTAATKAFADVGYELLHIRHRAWTYRLLSGPKDFTEATENAIGWTAGVIVDIGRLVISAAQERNLKICLRDDIDELYAEKVLPGHLDHNCGMRRAQSGAEKVTMLATFFLNLASASEDVRAASRAKPEEYALCLTDSLREERLRSLEFQFHNLQSQYDTHVSGTEAERHDTDLPVLRGHASVVLHLLKTATMFAHYYERHVSRPPCNSQIPFPAPVHADTMLKEMMDYSVTFIDQYIGSAVSLCQEILKRYAEVGQIEVPIPKYRGFHVRPSTMIAKLVLHYGSKVQMHLADEVYDASSPLDLFRANEKINAQKRRWLAQEIVRQGLVPEKSEPDDDVVSVVRNVVLTLAAGGKLMMYEQPLELPERLCPTEGTLVEKVINETSRLLVMGKIDIGIDMTARFVGDKRVLDDIALLAASGYGEDSFGNNIALPDKLGFLRR
jgi:hypothetical protein